MDYPVGNTQKPEFNMHEKMNTSIFENYLSVSEQIPHYIIVKTFWGKIHEK